MYEKKILVSSTHSIVRHGLKLMLNAATPHIIMSDARPLRQMSDVLGDHLPDIVIADVCGQVEELDQLLPLFSTENARPKLLLLCDLIEGDRRMGEIVRAAAGVLTSRGDAMDVLRIVGLAVSSLSSSIDSGSIRTSIHESAENIKGSQRPGAHITPREQQIMELIRQGCCNKRIARALEISVTTVRTHRQKLMAKLGLHNAVEIARYAAGNAVGAGLAKSAFSETHGGRN